MRWLRIAEKIGEDKYKHYDGRELDFSKASEAKALQASLPQSVSIAATSEGLVICSEDHDIIADIAYDMRMHKYYAHEESQNAMAMGQILRDTEVDRILRGEPTDWSRTDDAYEAATIAAHNRNTAIDV
jgi:hypothetical protein